MVRQSHRKYERLVLLLVVERDESLNSFKRRSEKGVDLYEFRELVSGVVVSFEDLAKERKTGVVK